MDPTQYLMLFFDNGIMRVNTTKTNSIPGQHKHQKKLLSQGGNVSITPVELPTEEKITSLELAMRTLSEEKAQEIRNETATILQ